MNDNLKKIFTAFLADTQGNKVNQWAIKTLESVVIGEIENVLKSKDEEIAKLKKELQGGEK